MVCADFLNMGMLLLEYIYMHICEIYVWFSSFIGVILYVIVIHDYMDIN